MSALDVIGWVLVGSGAAILASFALAACVIIVGSAVRTIRRSDRG